jgi:hypothetical protein
MPLNTTPGGHRRVLRGDQIEAGLERLGVQLARQVGHVRFAGEQHGELGGGLGRVAELDLGEIGLDALPVIRRPLDDQPLAGAVLLELVGGGAGRARVVAGEPLGLVLRLGIDHHLHTAGVDEGVVGVGRVEAEDDGVVVDGFHRGRLEPLAAAILGVGAGVQLVAVHHVMRGDGTPVEVELGVLVQVEGPLGAILVVLPGSGELRVVVLAGDGVVAHEALQIGQALGDAGEPDQVRLDGGRAHRDDQPVGGLSRAGEQAEQRYRTDTRPDTLDLEVAHPKHSPSLPDAPIAPDQPMQAAPRRGRRLPAGHSAFSIRCHSLKPFEVTPG